MKNLLFSLLFFSFSVVLTAQNEGVIEYSITDVSMPDMEKSDKMNAEMFKNMMKMQLTFSKTKSKMSVSVMGGMSTTQTFVDATANQSFTLMDVMGKKYKIINQVELSPEKRKEMDGNIEITYNTADRKKILDFDCYAVNIKIKDISKFRKEDEPESKFGRKKKENLPNEITMKAYITEALMPNVLTMNNMGDKVKGMALEYQMDNQMMKFILTATKFEKSVAKDAFVVPEGYEEITNEEFQKRMKGF